MTEEQARQTYERVLKLEQEFREYFTGQCLLTSLSVMATEHCCGARLSCDRASDFLSKGPGFKTTCCQFETDAVSFTPLCLCLSEETLKAVGPFYLGVYAREVKDPTRGKCITCCGLHLP